MVVQASFIEILAADDFVIECNESTTHVVGFVSNWLMADGFEVCRWYWYCVRDLLIN